MLAPLLPHAFSGINLGGLQFSEPTQLREYFLPPVAGIYAILVPNSDWRPRPFGLLYVGESNFIANRLTKQHEKYSDWLRQANSKPLYYCHYATSLWTEKERKDAECALINHYRPQCNVKVALVGTLLASSRRSHLTPR
jgi:hypothetical protein